MVRAAIRPREIGFLEEKKAMDMTGSVFISHSSKQADAAARVCEYLEKRGIQCWIAPRDIGPGSNYATQIVHAIRECSVLVLLASENTNSSGHVSNEVSLAFDNKKQIIPFKLEDITFSDEYLYFLGRKHWIDAYADFPDGLEKLYHTLTAILNISPGQPTPAPSDPPLRGSGTARSGVQHLSRAEMATVLIKKTSKFSYSLAERLENRDVRAAFEQNAEVMFSHSVKFLRGGREHPVEGGFVNQLVSGIREMDRNASITVSGLPGSAKNMLLQLAFFHLVDDFAAGRGSLLPCYISVNYFEKVNYEHTDVQQRMSQLIQEELAEFLAYAAANPDLTPVLFVDAVREHIIARVAPENVLNEVLKPLRSFKRVISIDMGLIKNKRRLKKVIPITGDRSGMAFQTVSLDAVDRPACLSFIRAIFQMYQVRDTTPEQVYDLLVSFKYSSIDIFLVRMLAQELTASFSPCTTAEMYEKMALRETSGDETALAAIAQELYTYIFDDSFSPSQLVYKGRQWSLAHKHHTYVEFLTAYYFACQIPLTQQGGDAAFFRTMLTAGEASFLAQMLREDFSLQDSLYHFVVNHYDSLDVFQKSNGAYWLGQISFKSLVGPALQFLMARFKELKPLVKGNNLGSQGNLDNQFLFRAVCTGLMLQGQTEIVDEYLCILVTNDVANALNRGSTIEYYGDEYQLAANDTYYLDSDLSAGAHAINALCHEVENSLIAKSGKFVENNLITLTTILQARIQRGAGQALPGLKEYVEKAIGYLELYQTRPQHISSNKIEFYLASVLDDFRNFVRTPQFDIGQDIYNKYRGIKDVKRPQWVAHCVEDPESVSEHIFSTWLLAMLFLPDHTDHPDYDKREVLDMLLVHDLAKAETGEQWQTFDNTDRDLQKRNTVLRKLFMKGTYPCMANLTYYYNIWTGYYNGININARVARDMNILQSVYTFCEYYLRYPQCFSSGDIAEWRRNQGRLTTEIGFSLWERLIEENQAYRALFLEPEP